MPDKRNCRDDDAPVTRRDMDRALKASEDRTFKAISEMNETQRMLYDIVREHMLGDDDGDVFDDDADDDPGDEEAPEPADVSALDFLLLHGLDDVLLADELVLEAAHHVMAGGGMLSYHLADELAGGVSIPGFTHRVARVLARLAREERGIVRLRPRSGVGPLVWFPAGVPLPAAERREYVVG